MSLRSFVDEHAHFFTISGWLMALAFGVLSIYFYAAGTKNGEISYIIKKTKIYDNSISTSDIIVARGSGGPQIKSDVYASEIVFWNSGDLRADSEEHHPDKPLTLSLEGAGEFLGWVVQRANKKDITSYKIRMADTRRSLSVEWTKFRPGFGMRLTALHTGTAETKVQVGADIFEFSLRERQQDAEPDSTFFGYPMSKARWVALLTAAVIIPVFLAMAFFQLRQPIDWSRRLSFYTAMEIATGRIAPAILGLMAIWLIAMVYGEFFGKSLPPV